jgi:hypothetical protein
LRKNGCGELDGERELPELDEDMGTGEDEKIGLEGQIENMQLDDDDELPKVTHQQAMTALLKNLQVE